MTHTNIRNQGRQTNSENAQVEAILIVGVGVGGRIGSVSRGGRQAGFSPAPVRLFARQA